MESLRDDFESDEYDGSEELLSRGVSYLLDELAVRYGEVVDEEKEIRLGFEERLYWRWGSAFDVMELYIMLNTQAGRLFYVLNGIGDKGENEDEEGADPLLEALVSLHIRACQVSREVLALMRAGYADGAFSRWRALYEMAASAQFIAEHGEGTAKRVLNHKIVDDYNEAREGREHSEALGFEQMKDDEGETLEETFEELDEEYGGVQDQLRLGCRGLGRGSESAGRRRRRRPGAVSTLLRLRQRHGSRRFKGGAVPTGIGLLG